MATLKTNTLTGTSTAGSIAVTGEGNSTTTNLQQGLAKMWCSFDQDSSGHPVYDSFNVASTSDAATGITIIAYTNNMANDDYAEVLCHSAESESGFGSGMFSATEFVSGGQKTTSQCGTDCRDNSSTRRDNHDTRVILLGDLA